MVMGPLAYVPFGFQNAFWCRDSGPGSRIFSYFLRNKKIVFGTLVFMGIVKYRQYRKNKQLRWVIFTIWLFYWFTFQASKPKWVKLNYTYLEFTHLGFEDSIFIIQSIPLIKITFLDLYNWLTSTLFQLTK